MLLSSSKRILIALALALVLPALTVLVLEFSELRGGAGSVETEALAKAEQVSLLTDLQLQSSITALEVLATSSSVTSEKWDRAQKRVETVAALNKDWKNVLVIDAKDNRPVMSLHDTEAPQLPAAVLQPDVASPVIGGVTREGWGCPCVYIFDSVPNEGKKPEYVIAVALSPQPFQDIVMSRTPKGGGMIALVDRDGNFVARSLDYEQRVGTPATSYVRNAIKKDKGGFYSGITYEGLKNYTAFFTSPTTGWSAHFALPSTLIDTPRQWSIFIAGLATLIALALATGLTLYILRNIDSAAAARMAAIVESSDDAIISKDLNGNIISWNPAAERILGYTPDEAIGQHISIIIPPDRLSEEDNIISKIKAGDRLSHFETLRRRKDGSLVDLSITVSPIKDKSGKIIGASKVARDISERRLTEEALRDERKTLETLNRLAPALAAASEVQELVQLATDEGTKVTGAAFGAFFYNTVSEQGDALMLYTLSGAPKAAFEHLGMPRATAVFAPTFQGTATVLSDDITVDPRYSRNPPYKGMPKGHLPVKSYLAVPVTGRNGNVIGGLFFGHPEKSQFGEREARLAEGIAALAAVGIDNARLYDEVKSGQKRAEDASRAKTDFLATMSHEIRTPMNAIIGLSSILAMSKPLTAKQSEFVKTLQSSADTLLQLINDLLDISKIEESTVELEEVPVSLPKLIDEVKGMLDLKAKEKGLVLSTDSAAVAHLTFLSDPVRLKQILNNLCSNAVKFTEQGVISLKVSLRASPNPDIANVTITVEDSGIGIASNKIGSIFDKFVQADTSISRKYGGTGLGLSITKRLVELLGGEISVESAEGIGTTFTTTLPLKVQNSIATPAPTSTAKKVRELAEPAQEQLPLQDDKTAPANDDKPPVTVLLVEDHEPNIMVATTFLDSLDYGYEIARNGIEAIEKIKARDFDAILMDVQMPGMNGYEATRTIRAFEKGEASRTRVPIIGVTAHALAGDRERCLSAGMDDYMPKPFDLGALQKKLETLIARRERKQA